MKAAVVVFPGSNCDSDCYHAAETQLKAEVQYVWHKEPALPKCDLVILPGGFSYGDYLRTGAIARFSPVMQAVKKHADEGRLVIGICNGFQILLEAGLLPGAMLRNRSLSFICKHVYLRVEDVSNPFTNKLTQYQTIQIPIAHGEGNYTCDDETMKQLKGENRIVFRYASQDGWVTDGYNPNGSKENIAGILNPKRNVLGMMPHPERASESILACEDGKKIWESLLTSQFEIRK